MPIEEPGPPKVGVHTLVRWLRHAPQRRYEWQLRRVYWRLRRNLLGLEFWLGKGIFRSKKQVRESIESASILASMLRTIVSQATVAIVLVAALWFLDRYVPTVAAIPINKELYASLLSTMAQVSGVFLGLYFTAVSVVASTVYARVPGDVRSVLMQEKVGTVYVRLVALLGAASILLLAMTAGGVQPHFLHLALIVLLSVLGVFSFVVLGTRAFYFFDPTSLADYVVRDLLEAIRLATPAGIEWDKPSFQAHYQTMAERALDTYHNLVSLALAEAHLGGRAAAALISRLFGVLNAYATEKIKIPGDSRWFKYGPRHREWLTTDYTQVARALQTGTALQPESVPNPMWLERRVERIALEAVRSFVEHKDYRNLYSILNAAQTILDRLGERLSIEEGLALFRALRPEVQRVALMDEETEETEQLALRLAVHDVYAMGLASLVLGVSRRVSQITAESFSALMESVNWLKPRHIYGLNVPRSVLEQLEYLRAGLEFEFRAGGALQSPVWYREQIACIGLARCLANAASELVGELAGSIVGEAKAVIDAGRHLPAAQIIQRGMEVVEKFRYHMREIRGCSERLGVLRRITDIPWPVTDWEKLDQRIEASREELIVLLGPLAMYLVVAPRREGLPDYFGQAYAVLAQESYAAMAQGREDLFKKLFPSLFLSGLKAFDRLREHLGGEGQERMLVYSTEPIADLLELSGYAIIYSELDIKGFWDVAHQLWDRYFEQLPDREAGANFIDGIVEYRRSLFAVLPRDLARTSWKQDLENRLRERGLMEDVFARRFGGREQGTRHASPVIRALARSEFLFEGPTDVFMAVYMATRPEAARLDLGRRTESFASTLERERAGEGPPEDTEETL